MFRGPAAAGGGRPPGGGPPAGGPPDDGPPELPAPLAERFEVIGDGPAAEGGEAVVWHVRERHGLRRQELALKLYYRGIRPDEKVAAKRTWKSAHLLRIMETEKVEERHYELAEWMPGGTVADLIGGPRGGLPAAVIHDLVRQLTEALTELHEQQIVHLDVKPANIAVRRPADQPGDTGPQAVLIDFGSAKRIDWRIVDYPDPPRTIAYAAPEVFTDAIALASDWWSLGMTVAELATGYHPLDGMTEKNILRQIMYGDELSLPDDVDPEVRLLCQGLLVRDPAYRWDDEQVQRWLDGDPPAPPERRGPLVSEHTAFAFAGQEYREPVLLAKTLLASWSEAAHELFGPADRWSELRGWLAPFGGRGGRESGATFALRLDQERLPPEPLPPEAALLVLIRWLYPGADALYLGIRVNPQWLPFIAATAIGGGVLRRPPGGSDDRVRLDEGLAVRILEDLWDYQLLPRLDQAPDGSGLAGIDACWRRYADDWDRVRRQVASIRPDLELDLEGWQGPVLDAWLLWLAADPRHEALLHGMVRAAQREIRVSLGQPRARLDWFDEVVNRAVNPAAWLAAYAVSPAALEEARQVRRRCEVRLESQRARERTWRQLQLARDWDRSVALGWAAAAAAIVAAGWFVLLQLMGGFRTAPEAAVSRAWIFASCAAILQLVIELSVAAAIGGPYYPRFALMSRIQRVAGLIGRAVTCRGAIGGPYYPRFALMSRIQRAAGRPGPTVIRRGPVASLVASAIALVVIVAVTEALAAVTAAVPFLLPLIVVPAHAFGAYGRHQDWRSYYDQRKAQVLESRATVTAGAAAGREPTEGDL